MIKKLREQNNVLRSVICLISLLIIAGIVTSKMVPGAKNGNCSRDGT